MISFASSTTTVPSYTSLLMAAGPRSPFTYMSQNGSHALQVLRRIYIILFPLLSLYTNSHSHILYTSVYCTTLIATGKGCFIGHRFRDVGTLRASRCRLKSDSCHLRFVWSIGISSMQAILSRNSTPQWNCILKNNDIDFGRVCCHLAGRFLKVSLHRFCAFCLLSGRRCSTLCAPTPTETMWSSWLCLLFIEAVSCAVHFLSCSLQGPVPL